MDNSTYEIHPLTEKLQRIAKRQASNTLFDNRVPHIIKRASFNSDSLLDEIFPSAGNVWNRNEALQSGSLEEIFENEIDGFQRRGQTMTLEVAMFLDEAAYKIFAPYFGYDDKKLQNMLLAYLNGVCYIFYISKNSLLVRRNFKT